MWQNLVSGRLHHRQRRDRARQRGWHRGLCAAPLSGRAQPPWPRGAGSSHVPQPILASNGQGRGRGALCGPWAPRGARPSSWRPSSPAAARDWSCPNLSSPARQCRCFAAGNGRRRRRWAAGDAVGGGDVRAGRAAERVQRCGAGLRAGRRPQVSAHSRGGEPRRPGIRPRSIPPRRPRSASGPGVPRVRPGAAAPHPVGESEEPLVSHPAGSCTVAATSSLRACGAEHPLAGARGGGRSCWRGGSANGAGRQGALAPTLVPRR